MRLPRLVPFAAALLAALALSACKGEETTEDDGWKAEPQPEAKDFVFTVTAEQQKVELGGDIVLKARVQNDGEVKTFVNVPRLGLDSVTLRVRSDALDAGVVTLDPRPVREIPTGFQQDPAEVKEIGKGETADGEIRFTAVLPGKFVITPAYTCQSLVAPLTATPIEIEVTPSPNGTKLGLRFETSHGTLDAGLRPELAFQTCTMVATLVRKGFYDGLGFHRVIRGFMAQGGDPKGVGWGGPGWVLRRELHGKLPHRRGVFGMARRDKPSESVGSQFYVMFAEAPHLDADGYTTFAELRAGQDALARIEAVAAEPTSQNGPPREPIVIVKASLLVYP